MLNKDTVLLEQAYLAIKKPMVTVPSDEREEDVMDASVDPTINSVEPGVSEPVTASSEPMGPVSNDVMSEPPVGAGVMEPETGCSCEEDEAHEMSISNLNSIRESIVKIASHCAGGHKLEAWAQQKLAISMDGLAAVARSLGTHCRS